MPLSVADAARTAETSLVRDGDVWVCLGDSITAVNCYPRVLERMFKHWHPQAAFSVINSGVGGDTASDDPAKLADRVLRHRPSIVSIMYGMNETINGWRAGQPVEPFQAAYRKNLTWLARTLRQQGITVLLMSPTLTDPSCRSYFTLEKTGPFLVACAAIVREVAASEGALYVPVQEAFAACQKAQPGGVSLTIDGVHPAALGQYAIAEALASLAGFAAPLAPAGPRALVAPAPQVPVNLALERRFLGDADAGLEFVLTTSVATDVEAIVSVGDLRRQETLHLAAGSNRWSLPLAQALRPTRNGQAADVLIELRRGAARSLHIVDLCRTEVLHLRDGQVSGFVDGAGGRRIADWTLTRLGDSLRIDFTVTTRSIHAEEVWPFARDGLNLMLDFRPTGRFADIGVDREVTQLFLNVREQPFFAVGVRAWSGYGMDLAATAAGERTPTGYTAHLLIHDNFDLRTPVGLGGRDFIGLLVAVAEHDSGTLNISVDQRNDQVVNAYANNLKILDLKDRLPGDHVINAHVARLPHPATIRC